MKKIVFLFLFVSAKLFAVHDTTIVDRTCLIEFNWQGKTVVINKSMCKVLLGGSTVYVYDNSLSDHKILNGAQTTYVLDYRQIETPVCPTPDSLRKAIVKILNTGNCGGSGGGGSVSITAGQGLTVTPSPITGTGSVAVTNLGITNGMIANGTINLTQKVTGVLPVVNGGTGWSFWALGDLPVGNATSTLGQLGVGDLGQVLTVVDFPGVGEIPRWANPKKDTVNKQSSLFTIGSIPFQGSGKKLIEDNANLFYDSINKTLRTTRQLLSGRAGVTPLTIYPNNSQAIYIESQKGGINLSNTNTDVPGIIVRTDGLGVALDSKEMALRSTSEKQAAVFNQTGEAAADVSSSVVVISRDVNNDNIDTTVNCTGAMLDIVNNIPYVTTSTGPLIRAKDASIERFVVKNDGRAYFNTQTDIKQSVSGSLGFDISQVQTVGSTATDIFSYTLKGNTLLNDGDEFVAKYSFYIAEASKSKTLTVVFAGSNVATYTFTPSQAAGAGTLKFTIIKTGSNLYAVSVDIDVIDGNPGTTVLLSGKYVQNSGATLTSNQILKVTATCQAGSLNSGVRAHYAKYYYNPNN